MNVKKLNARAKAAKLQVENLSLPSAPTDGIESDSFSLAFYCGDLAVIEIECCFNEQIDPYVRRFIDQADSYTEYVPRSEGIRIIGYSLQKHSPLETISALETPACLRSTLSIYRCCHRWINISGIAILDQPFSYIDDTIDELLARTGNYLYMA
jgi:hypothetical protein